MSHLRSGFLAGQAGYQLPLEVLQSGAGFYIGTRDQGGPVSRESQEYFPDEQAAQQSLELGRWTQREHP